MEVRASAGVAVVDASVLIALLDASDVHHERATKALTDPLLPRVVVPASAYAETLVGPSRRGVDAIRRVDDLLADLAADIMPLTAEIARRAAALRASHTTLRLPDALVLATGDTLETATVLTTDRRWTRYSSLVRLI